MSNCQIHPLPYHAEPSDYFRHLYQAPGAVMLDSGRPQALRGRYDLMSAWPLAELAPFTDESAKSFLQRLRQTLATLEPATADGFSPPFVGGLIGYLSYDFGRSLQPLNAPTPDHDELPRACFGLYTWALITDHHEQLSYLLFHPSLPAAERQRLQMLFAQPHRTSIAPFSLQQPFAAALDSTQYQQAIERIQDYILAGDCYQVNFTQLFSAPCLGEPFSAYKILRQACPTPFAGYLSLGQGNAVVSLSPERFIKLEQAQVETRPIKGTRPRGATPAEDEEQAQALLNSDKDRAENLMIVDLLRNDLGRTCRTGSVRVPQLFALESYPNVHHLVSAVTGQLAEGKDAFDLIADSFPGGSITGAPKIRAMQIIDELEPVKRSIYCGSLLYIDARGEMDSSIAIRTLLVREQQISCWGGGGIVTDSDWQAEYHESITKVALLLRTLEQASSL